MSSSDRKVVLVTGAAGGIGSKVAAALKSDFEVVGVDLDCKDADDCFEMDLGSDSSVQETIDRITEEYGKKLASVVHLAAYFDFSGEASPLYDEVNVEGTRRLLKALEPLEVDQLVYSSTMLVHAPTEPGSPIDEESPLDARWPYPQSKLATEKVLAEHPQDMRRVVLRIAGVYTDECGAPSLSHQIQRIYERNMTSHVFSGDVSRGQSFVHRDDVIDAIVRTVERREDIDDGTSILIGEPEVLSYETLQNRIGELIHGETWRTIQVPKPLARAGAWVQEKSEPIVPDAFDHGEKPFIRSFMIPLADDHYELDVSRARELLDWEPSHSLQDWIEPFIEKLNDDPEAWYQANGLRMPDWMRTEATGYDNSEDLRARNERYLRKAHRRGIWAPFFTMALGTWLISSPATLGYESEALGISDTVSGILVLLFGLISLSWRHQWARLASAAVGVYLLFAPLVFWAPTAAAYLNETLIGALIIGFSMLVRPHVGISPIARMTGPQIPPGWQYSPSGWTQRLPIIILAFVGLYISRYLAAFQLGHIGTAWDPFFANGTERVISSQVSESWPVSDAGVGAVTYMLEILTGMIGGRDRWRTMPWLVILFGIMIVPLGAISIFFIVIQPIVIGTWCTLCLVAALAMVVQIPYSLDELVATGQFLAERRRKGRPLLRVFFTGDTMEGGAEDAPESFERPVGVLLKDIWGGGVNVPWTLLISALIGIWLMFTRITLGTEPPMAHADHLLGALVVTISVTAMAEVARPVRFLNTLLGIALLGTPWLLDGATMLGDWATVAAGLALIALSIPRGPVNHGYGSWNRWVW